MCELTAQEYEADTGTPLYPHIDPLARVFEEHLKSAEVLAAKIHRAAELCRKAEQEERHDA